MAEEKRLRWENERRKLVDLRPQEDNPRHIDKDSVEHLRTSWDDYGQVDPLAVGPDGSIYNGHQRYYVLLDRHGPDFEVDVRVASRSLSRREWQRLTVFLHEGAVGDWDFDGLANWDGVDVDDLVNWGFDPAALGLEDWGKEEPPADPGAQIDKAAELQEKWGTALGQLWEVGRHRIVCGDCTEAAVVEAVMQGEKAAMVWTDPPYHVGKVFEGGLDEGKEWDSEFQNAWIENTAQFYEPPAQRYVCFAQAQSKDAILCYEPRRLLVWCKPFALMRANAWDWAYEFIAWCYDTDVPAYFNKPAGTASFDWQEIASVIHGHEGKHHITQKPIALPSNHIWASSRPDAIVADWFLGSGTTLVACEQLGRIGRGIELSPAYIAVALERLAEMGMEPKLVGTI